VSEAAQQLLELLKDAKPKGGDRVQSVGTPQKRGPVTAALKAVRFTAELPELGGAIELSPRLGFSPVHCKHCGIERESRREHWHDKKNNKHHVWWAPAPCNCGGLR
jgi:hypothetical protein